MPSAKLLTMSPAALKWMIGGSERWWIHVPPVPSGMMPIAAPAFTLPRCGQFSTIRYGLLIAFTPGNGAGAAPRPCCAATAAHNTVAITPAAASCDVVDLEDAIGGCSFATS